MWFENLKTIPGINFVKIATIFLSFLDSALSSKYHTSVMVVQMKKMLLAFFGYRGCEYGPLNIREGSSTLVWLNPNQGLVGICS